ncbi:hypothetical protein RchiOBHm_Chr3g0456751 [Rosa chinensis]|uniref:Uncharacterized protein n=1 Tax=Rosa chinensis TaxID=74649 RepID=A0A2P6R7E8_ROSCH|nr:hypothetical protein RchiOBHm_Chr3g0456751 [Rosa chinensis]
MFIGSEDFEFIRFLSIMVVLQLATIWLEHKNSLAGNFSSSIMFLLIHWFDWFLFLHAHA